MDVGEDAGVITLVGLAERGFRGRPGDRVQVSMQGTSAFHCFDPTTGVNLGAGDGTGPARSPGE